MRSSSLEMRTEDLERGPVRVRNRDIPLLARVEGVMQMVVSIERRRAWERERMQNITSHLSGMPGGGGVPKGYEEAFAALSELEEEHQKLCRMYVRELKKAESIVNAIESVNMRAFVVMKYMMDVPDARIREELNMTRTGFERARRCVERAEHMAAVDWRERYIIGNGT